MISASHQEGSHCMDHRLLKLIIRYFKKYYYSVVHICVCVQKVKEKEKPKADSFDITVRELAFEARKAQVRWLDVHGSCLLDITGF